MTRIYDYLKSKGIAVYFPGQKIGKGNYTVVSEGSTRGINSRFVGSTKMKIICVGEKSSYVAFELYKNKVKSLLREISFIMFVSDSGIFADSSSDSYICSIDYVLMRKIGG